MSNILELSAFVPHKGQARILKMAKRFNVVATGRRYGKTSLIFIIVAIVSYYNLIHKRPANIAVIAPSLKNLRKTWRKFKKMFEPLITYKSEMYMSFTIQDLFDIEFWSIEQIELMRGNDYCIVLFDETALIKGLQAIWNSIVFPTLNDWQGQAWFFSTPRGFNDFYTFYDFASRPLFKDTWASFHATFLDNPENKRSEYELAKQQFTADFFAQEYEAKFVSLGNNLFDRKHFEVVPPNEFEGEILHQIRYWDIASSHKGDYTASLKLTVTDKPYYYLSMPFHKRGKWGQVYPLMKHIMMSEAADDVAQVIETDGIGNIAWQMIMHDEDLSLVRRFPADRRFTKQNKYDRASLWALEAQLGRVKLEENSETSNILDEFEKFPYGTTDDYVDTVSGGFLAINYLFGGFGQLAKNKNLTSSAETSLESQSSRSQRYARQMERILKTHSDYLN